MSGLQPRLGESPRLAWDFRESSGANSPGPRVPLVPLLGWAGSWLDARPPGPPRPLSPAWLLQVLCGRQVLPEEQHDLVSAGLRGGAAHRRLRAAGSVTPAPARPAGPSPTIAAPPPLMGGTALPHRRPSVCDPPGARLGLYSLSSVYKWEHLFYDKCNAILLLAWIKLMNVPGRWLRIDHVTDVDLGPLPLVLGRAGALEAGMGLQRALLPGQGAPVGSRGRSWREGAPPPQVGPGLPPAPNRARTLGPQEARGEPPLPGRLRHIPSLRALTAWQPPGPGLFP